MQAPLPLCPSTPYALDPAPSTPRPSAPSPVQAGSFADHTLLLLLSACCRMRYRDRPLLEAAARHLAARARQGQLQQPEGWAALQVSVGYAMCAQRRMSAPQQVNLVLYENTTVCLAPLWMYTHVDYVVDGRVVNVSHHHHHKTFRNKSHTSHGQRPGLERNKSKVK